MTTTVMSAVLVHTADGGWAPGIGDPTFMGWFTVFAYVVAANLCLRAWRRAKLRRPVQIVLVRAWLGTTWLMGLLGINKQLDLQSLITVVGRRVAIEQGWYADRHSVQIQFIKTIAALGVLSLIALLWLARSYVRELWLPVVGAVFIVVFVIVRASSFHDVDLFLSGALGGPRWNWVLELGGIGCVGLGARRYSNAARKTARQPR